MDFSPPKECLYPVPSLKRGPPPPFTPPDAAQKRDAASLEISCFVIKSDVFFQCCFIAKLTRTDRLNIKGMVAGSDRRYRHRCSWGWLERGPRASCTERLQSAEVKRAPARAALRSQAGVPGVALGE